VPSVQDRWCSDIGVASRGSCPWVFGPVRHPQPPINVTIESSAWKSACSPCTIDLQFLTT
jgi:hypothetical protein